MNGIMTQCGHLGCHGKVSCQQQPQIQAQNQFTAHFGGLTGTWKQLNTNCRFLDPDCNCAVINVLHNPLFSIHNTSATIKYRCECGAESIGVNNHSHWCPKNG